MKSNQLIAGRCTERCRKIMLQIMALAISTPSAIADIFVDFAAHTNGLHVRIYEAGYHEEKDPETCECYIDREDSKERLLKILDRLHEVRGGETRKALLAANVAAEEVDLKAGGLN